MFCPFLIIIIIVLKFATNIDTDILMSLFKVVSVKDKLSEDLFCYLEVARTDTIASIEGQ